MYTLPEGYTVRESWTGDIWILFYGQRELGRYYTLEDARARAWRHRNGWAF